jgi:hypothetical protein
VEPRILLRICALTRRIQVFFNAIWKGKKTSGGGSRKQLQRRGGRENDSRPKGFCFAGHLKASNDVGMTILKVVRLVFLETYSHLPC